MADLDKSKFDLAYFFKGEGLKDWYKALGNGWRLAAIIIALVFVGVTIYRAYFTKNQTQTQKMIIYPFSFSTVTFSPQQEQKQEVKKRAWWMPIFFVEGYGFAETSGINNSRTGLGGRAGGRLEW
jgi:hypothetical protein